MSGCLLECDDRLGQEPTGGAIPQRQRSQLSGPARWPYADFCFVLGLLIRVKESGLAWVRRRVVSS